MQYSKPLLTLSSSRLEGSKTTTPKKILILTPNKKRNWTANISEPTFESHEDGKNKQFVILNLQIIF